jgi:hypothetical protein
MVLLLCKVSAGGNWQQLTVPKPLATMLQWQLLARQTPHLLACLHVHEQVHA